MNYADIYFAIASISTIAVAGLIVVLLMHLLSILYNIRKLSKLARKEAEVIAKGFEKGASFLGSELSSETAGFVKAVFALLLSQFASKTVRKSKKKNIKDI